MQAKPKLGPKGVIMLEHSVDTALIRELRATLAQAEEEHICYSSPPTIARYCTLGCVGGQREAPPSFRYGMLYHRYVGNTSDPRGRTLEV